MKFTIESRIGKITFVARDASEKRISKMNLNRNTGPTFFKILITDYGGQIFWTR